MRGPDTVHSGVGTIQLQVSLKATEQMPANGSLGAEIRDVEVSQVAFMDTPDLALLRGGVVIRATRTQDMPAVLAVTLLWADPAGLPSTLRQLPGFTADVDVRRVGFACSCTLAVPVTDRRLDDLLVRRTSVRGILSGDQRRIVSLHVTARVPTDDLVVLGPLYVLTHRLSPPGLPHGLAVQQWFLPDGTHRLHLAAPAKRKKVVGTAERTAAYLRGLGVDPDPARETTSRSALVALATTGLGRGPRSGLRSRPGQPKDTPSARPFDTGSGSLAIRNEVTGPSSAARIGTDGAT